MNEELDYFPTPEIYTEILLKHEQFSGDIFEPCAGTNGVVNVLNKDHLVVWADIQNGADFFKCETQHDNIVCSPPFHLSKDFVVHAMKLARNKISMLMRAVFIESTKQQSIFKNTSFPLRSILVMRKTLPFANPKYLNGYCWYTWERGYVGKALIEWVDMDRQESL